MVPRKTDQGLRKFWPDLEISEAFWMGLEVSESRICRFFFPLVFRSRPEFFRLSWQQLIELSYQIKMIVKQEKAVNWWASANFHCRFWSFQLALLICTIVNFWRLESRGSEFFRSKVSRSELIKTLKSRSRILKPGSRSLEFTILFP